MTPAPSQTGANMSPQQRFTGASAVAASPGSHSRPPMPPGSGRMSFDFSRAPGEGRRTSISGLPPPGSRPPSFDLGGGGIHSAGLLQGLQEHDQGAGQGSGGDRPGSAQSA